MALPPAFVEEVRARTGLVALISRYVRLTKSGGEYTGCCPFHGEKTPSFSVVEKKGFAHCFGCGWHGDAIDFVMAYDGRTFMEALRLLADEAGMVVPGDENGPPARPLAPVVARPAPESIDHDRERDIVWARDTFGAALPWRGTQVETYLAGRRCCPDRDVSGLRFVPALNYRDRWPDGRPCNGAWPAMVAAIRRPDGTIGGLHRTYLAPDGQGKAPVPKAKKMRGDSWGGAIRLTPAAAVLALAEGIETGLSVLRAVPDLAIWVAGSLGNMAGGGDRNSPALPHPTRENKKLPPVVPDMDRPGIVPPEGVRQVIILADSDGDQPTGRALVECAARRYMALGIEVLVAWPPAGKDFNDVLAEAPDEETGLAQIRALVAAAAPPVLTDLTAPQALPAQAKAPAAVPPAPTLVWGDRAAAAALWADCLPLARGVPQGVAYLRRMGAPVGPGDASRTLYKRLRVGVMPRQHMGADGTIHDLGRHPCLVAAFGPRGAKGVMRIWLDGDGEAQSWVADPDMPARALSPYELVGEVAGAIEFGAMAEGLAVAVTLECALTVLAHAPGAVWAVPSLAAVSGLDVPQGLRRVYLAVWQVWTCRRDRADDGTAVTVWAPPARREAEISAVGWGLSAAGKRELMRLDVPMPAGWSPLPDPAVAGWSPLPGLPCLPDLSDQEVADAADIAAWENEGGRL